MTDPFDDIRQALATDHDEDPKANLRLDFDRASRTGIPEIVNAEHKQSFEVAQAMRELVAKNGRAIATRVDYETGRTIKEMFNHANVKVNQDTLIAIATDGVTNVNQTGGRIGVISAGTSDRYVAEEAKIIAREMGCSVTVVTDVGVAGLHRLIAPLRDLMAKQPDAIVVAAGMDGALPSVVAGLVDVPVIGLPISSGYGLGGDGTAALYSMLQSCAPGLAVVNIDNGVGAGAMAALIANRAAMARNSK